jgi:pilus assembly protein CpaE
MIIANAKGPMHTVLLSHNSAHPLPLKLRELLSGRSESPLLVDLERAESYLTQLRASHLLVILSPFPERAFGVLRRVRSLVDGSVLAVGPASDPKLILQALNEGASHYVEETDLEGQLDTVLARLTTREESLHASTGCLVAVLGASGGSGTSTLAANLAAVLAREARRCALIDLHPGAGDLAPLLDLKPAHTLADLCVKGSLMDQAMIESSLTSHSSGIGLLAPPRRFDEIPLVTPHGVQKALALIRQLFPFTVVDQEDCFHEEQVIALRQADRVLVVLRPDFTSLRNAHRLLEHLDQLDLRQERVQLVLNRCGQAKELPTEEVEKGLGMRVAHHLPDDPRTINAANNAGIPAVLKVPSAKVSQTIVELARGLIPGGQSVAGRSSPRRSKSWLIFR